MIKFACQNPDCNFAETGKCVEGFEIGKCPHQVKEEYEEEVENPDNSSSEYDVTEEDKSQTIINGDVLDINQATSILCEGPNRVICLIGPRESGKTTLGISLYDAFQNGPYNYWYFSGSKTLLAFERRCHYARVSCGKSKPDTPRTSLSEGLGFLHFSVHSQETRKIELLISDRSGEFYERIANNLENCNQLFEVKRANSIIFLIDGERLIGDERYGLKNEIVIILKTLLQNKIITEFHRLSLVLTKYDLVVTSENKEQAEDLFEAIYQNFIKNCDSLCSEIKSYKISARPENDSLEMRYGLFELFENFLITIPKKFTSHKISNFYDRFFHCLT